MPGDQRVDRGPVSQKTLKRDVVVDLERVGGSDQQHQNDKRQKPDKPLARRRRAGRLSVVVGGQRHRNHSSDCWTGADRSDGGLPRCIHEPPGERSHLTVF
jgi:hypothetical protein